MDASASIIGGNIRRFRAAKKINQKALAQDAGISRVTLSKIEKGSSLPRAETIELVAHALNVAVGQLVTEVPDLTAVRFRSLKRHHERDLILADVAHRLQRYREIEDLLRDRSEFKLRRPRGRKKWNPIDLATWVRGETVLQKEPIRDICGFLEKHGVKVLRTRRSTDAFFGLSVAPDCLGPAVIVNTWERISVERWIFSAAHEFGHLLMHLDAYDSSVAVEDPDEEKEANLFAGHLLMPNQVFESEWGDTSGLPLVDRVFKVKRIFRVSYRSVIYRLVENGLVDDGIWRLFQNLYRKRCGRTLRKGDEPVPLGTDEFLRGVPACLRAHEPEQLSDMDFQEDRLSRLVRRAFQRGVISLGFAAEALGVSREQVRDLAREWVVLDDVLKR